MLLLEIGLLVMIRHLTEFWVRTVGFQFEPVCGRGPLIGRVAAGRQNACSLIEFSRSQGDVAKLSKSRPPGIQMA